MKKIQLILIITSLILFSCSEDSIDLQPKTAISADVIFKDPAFAELLLNKVYSGIPHGFNRGWYMLASATDDAENSYPWPSSNTRFNPSNVTPANSPFNGLWNNSYAQIRRLNSFIANYDQLEGAEAITNRLKGEAHFLRGLWYTYLLRTFGEVPVIKIAQNLDDELLVPRNSRQEILDFIVEELDKSVMIFGDLETSNSTRGNALAAKSLKGRVLLYEGQFTQSALASKEVIESGSKSLDPNYESLFLDDNSPEVIFDVQFKDPDKGHSANKFNTPKTSSGPFSGWGGTGPTQNLVDQYEMQATGKIPAEAGSGYDINTPYEGRDPRFYASIIYDGTMWKGITIDHRPGGLYGMATSGDFTRTGYSMRKMIIEDRNDDLLSIQHWIFIRLSEVYLNYAEALIEANTDLDLAVEAINIVRARAEMPPIEMSNQEDLRAKVRHERRIELAFEEHRFWDIRRWGIAEDPENLIIYRVDMDEDGKLIDDGKEIWETRVWNQRDYLMPIPQNEIDKNSNLTQNPGY